MSKWNELIHNGPYIEPEFEKVNDLFIYYDKEKLDPPVSVQKYIIDYCAYKRPIDELFKKNFFTDLYEQYFPLDWKKYNKFELFDFKDVREYIKNREKPIVDKQKNKEIEDKYGYCILDGERVRVENYRMETAGIFSGLGPNPNRGRLKPRITADIITINTSTPPSEFPPPSHGNEKWKEIVALKDSIYTSAFYSEITRKTKYTYLSRESKFKVSSEIDKYNIARRLHSKIDDIREKYMDMIKNRQEVGIILYLLDVLSLRVGNTGKNNSAPTYGATTILKKHLVLLPNNKVLFNFPGKDSINYVQEAEIDPVVYKRIEEIHKTKDDNDTLFSVNSEEVNNKLKDFHKDLTTKVFRTYNASWRLYNELNSIDVSQMSVDRKIFEFEKVNHKIAMLSNHRKQKTEVEEFRIQKLKSEIAALEEETKGESLESIEKRKNDISKEEYKKLKKAATSLEKKKFVLSRTESLAGASLITSKKNYIDPRVVIKWLMENQIPLKKVYPESVLKAHSWAIKEVEENIYTDYPL